MQAEKQDGFGATIRIVTQETCCNQPIPLEFDQQMTHGKTYVLMLAAQSLWGFQSHFEVHLRVIFNNQNDFPRQFPLIAGRASSTGTATKSGKIVETKSMAMIVDCFQMSGTKKKKKKTPVKRLKHPMAQFRRV